MVQFVAVAQQQMAEDKSREQDARRLENAAMAGPGMQLFLFVFITIICIKYVFLSFSYFYGCLQNNL
jgi:hypothetical protein